MKVVVFGIGFVGGALVREFAARRYEVTAVSRRPGTDFPEGVAHVAGRAHDPTFVQDMSSFPAWLVPRVEAHSRVMDRLDSAPEGVAWFYFVPAADFGPHHRGIRTGSYRTSTTAQVVDDEGYSAIGVEDYAIAFADEIEDPSIHRTLLAVGY